MERIAIPIWNNRVSPVLDTATQLVVFEAEDLSGPGVVTQLPAVSFAQRARLIKDLQVTTLLCGAVSRCLMDLLTRYGVTVHPWLTGDVNDILRAYRDGGLGSARFILPGCELGQRRRRGRGRMRGCGRRR